ncbi:hypothetical protein BC832DRAFT_594521 [Gaertneriomyces semiglobifer]|nr:hypothetical protein BC832DRAFT_594521 [Gaertneriomyces semiglobifer]
MSEFFTHILLQYNIPVELDIPLLNLCRNKPLSPDDVLTIIRTIPNDALDIIRGHSNASPPTESQTPKPVPITLDEIDSILQHRYVTSRKGEEVNDSKNKPGWKDYAWKSRQALRRLSSEFRDTFRLWKLNDLVDYIMTKRRCGHEWKATSAQTNLCHISTLLRLMTDEEKTKYGVDHDHLECIKEHELVCREIIAEVYEDQQLTPTEQELIIPQEELVSAVNQYASQNPITRINNRKEFVVARNVFIGRVHTEQPPRRLDVLKTKILNITDRDNYINWETGCLVLNDYKTKNIYGSYTMKLSDETLRIARLMRDFCMEQGRCHLMGCNDRITDYTPILQDAFETICGKRLSCNILRKMYIDHAWNEGSLKYAKERIQLATMMGHTVSTQQLIYTKRSPFEVPKKRPCEDEEDEEEELEERHAEVLASTSGSVEPTKRRMTESQKQIIKNAIEQWQKSDEYVGLVREGRKPVFSWKRLQSQFVNEFGNVSERTMQAYGRHHIAALRRLAR